MYPAIESERNARRTNSTRMMRSFKGSPPHVQAPVDAQDLPGDVGGLRGSEKPDGGCDLLRVPQPLEGDPPLHRPDDLRPRLPTEVLREKRRVRRARAYAGDPDFVLGDLTVYRPGGRDTRRPGAR